MPGDSQFISPPSQTELRIGAWCVERSLNQLRRGAQIVRLEPKAIEVLTYLADRPGEVVSREELMAKVWPGVIVGDDAITHAVIKLRKALGDTAREPAYIETIAKRGYRLIAPVARQDTVVGERQVHPPPTTGRRRTRIAVAAALAAACVGVGGALLTSERAGNFLGFDLVSRLQPDLSVLAVQPTIVVRPFEVLGEDPLQSVLAGGLTSDLTTDLSKVSGVTVLGGPRPVREPPGPSEALAAQYVVSGSVQRDSDRLRVNVHLTDAKASRQVWSERFERAAGDLFSVQDDILRRILEALPVKISEAERLRVARRYTRSLEAYELLHRGLLAMGAREQTQNEAARNLYWRAIGLDPGFARAYAGVAMTYVQDFRQQWAEDGRETLAKALELAETARKIDPESPEVLWVLAFAKGHAGKHAEALRLLQTALRLNPSYADAYFLMGVTQMEIGRPREALAWLHSAMRLVPNPGYIHHYGFGQAYFFLGDLEQARANLAEALLRKSRACRGCMCTWPRRWLGSDTTKTPRGTPTRFAHCGRSSRPKSGSRGIQSSTPRSEISCGRASRS